jgi:hypothetical protein
MKTKMFMLVINGKDTDYIDSNKEDLLERIFIGEVLCPENFENNKLTIEIVELEVKKKNG